MGFISDLIAKAQGVLGAAPTPPTATDALVHDRFDEAVFEETFEDAGVLKDLDRRLNQKHAHTRELVRDTFMSFYKSDPKLRPAAEMDLEYLANHAVAADIANAPETAETRSHSQHDRYGAALATVAVGEKVQKVLERVSSELEAKAEAAAQAQQRAQERAQALAEAAQAAADKAGDYDGEGPMTAGQQAAATALAEALAAAEQAQADANAAQGDAQGAADAAGAQMNQAVRQGIDQASKALSEESELMSAWGIGEGELKRMNFQERADLANALRGNRLNKFRQLIGRFRMMASAERSKKVEYGRDEAYDVTLGDHLEDVLSSELAGLANDHLRLLFLDKLANRQLLSRKYRGVDKEGQGAIIAVIDESGSMGYSDKTGITRDAWAKGFALALLDQAIAGKRDFVAVCFSSEYQQRVFRFPANEPYDLPKVLEFTEHFFDGGTDFMRPMGMAVDVLEREYNQSGKQRGDLVMITDDDCGVTSTWLRDYQERKEKLGFRTFGIAVGTHAGQALSALSDNVRSVTEFMDPAGVADIIRSI